MEPSAKLPEVVLKDLSLYMAPGERVIDFISSASGPVGKLGELWMILSDTNVFFHTREYGKNPVVALLARKEIKVVRYDQHANGTNLIFVPVNHPSNMIKMPFPKAQRALVNRFCEELAKTVPFELVTPAEKIKLEQQPSWSPELKSEPAQEAVVDRKRTEVSPSQKFTSEPPPLRKTARMNPSVTAEKSSEKTPQLDQGVKISKSTAPSDKIPPGRPDGRQPSPSGPLPSKDRPQKGAEEAEVVEREGPGIQFVLIATFASMVVGFLWYQLFRSLSESK